MLKPILMQVLDMIHISGALELLLRNQKRRRRRIHCSSCKTGCFLTQTVRVRKVEDPVIQTVELNNNNATVVVSGGKAPYKYSVDGTANWQLNIHRIIKRTAYFLCERFL
jgi:hypothetical protein